MFERAAFGPTSFVLPPDKYSVSLRKRLAGDGQNLDPISRVKLLRWYQRAPRLRLMPRGYLLCIRRPTPGPLEKPKLFVNVTTPAEDTAQAAAYLAIANSDGQAGVVIFTDSAFTIALAKSNANAQPVRFWKFGPSPWAPRRKICLRLPLLFCRNTERNGLTRSVSTTFILTEWFHL